MPNSVTYAPPVATVPVYLMDMLLKSDSPDSVIAAIKAIEDRADRCSDNLELYSFPKGLTSWAILVRLVLWTEQLRQEHGYRNYDVILSNLSKRGALALRWIEEKGKNSTSDPDEYVWKPSLARAIDEALAVAASYQVFLDFFPMWHQNMQFGELLSDSAVRFTVLKGVSARRVSAFQKGFKPVLQPAPSTGIDLTPCQERARDAALSQCFWSRPAAIQYPEPSELYRLLFPTHLERLCANFRRGDSIDLGPYTLGELKRAYAALNTVLSVHEDFCYRLWLRDHGYPVNSCVMVRTRNKWAAVVSHVAGLEHAKCSAIIDDLTLTNRFWDLQVHPFIPIDGDALAAAPQFPLHARADENILRVCGHRRPSYFDEAASIKEQEMLDDLLPACPRSFSAIRQIPLPNGLPDLDLLLADEDSQSVVVAELKWLRKAFGSKERVHRKEDFEKGLRQLSKVRTFLGQNPTYLSSRGKLKSPLDKYQHVTFVLVARDYFVWPDRDDVIVVDHEIFKEALSTAASLPRLIEKLSTFDWLPVEGKDFRVVFEPTAVNGVTVESETFYRI